MLIKQTSSKSLLKQSGVSLIEILITTLVLAVGLLGVAALQVSSISSNQEGFYTSQATSIAEDLVSRIRSAKVVTMIADEDQRILYSTYVAHYGDAAVNPVAYDCAAAPAVMCRNNAGAEAESCTFQNLADFDKWDICTIADNTLPRGKVRVASIGNRLSIVVDWDSEQERRDIGKAKNINENCQTVTNDEERNCIIMEILP